MNEKEVFRHKYIYSTFSIVISAILLPVFFFAIYTLFLRGSVVSNSVATALTLIFLWIIGIAPIYYEIDEKEIRIRLLLYKLRLQRSEYELSQSEENALDAAFRVWGSGGFMGFTGFFWSKQERHFFCLLSRCSGPFIWLRKRDSKRKILLNGKID